MSILNKGMDLSHYDRSAKVIFLLLSMSVVCCLMVGFRFVYTGNYTYRFLIWNLFLAWIPLLAAYQLRGQFFRPVRQWGTMVVYAAFWLLFLPNSPYIVTDLIHLEDRSMSGHDIHLIYDATLIFAFALTGLLTGFVSLYWVHKVLDQIFAPRMSWGLITAVLVLTGYGVYLGRVVRWNSWDILVHPRSLLVDVLTHITHYTAFSLTVLFSVFLLFAYLILHSFIAISQSDSENHRSES